MASKPAKRPAAKTSRKKPALKPSLPAGEPTLRWTRAQLLIVAEDLKLELAGDATKATILEAIDTSRRSAEAASVPRGERLYAALTTETSPDAIKVLAEEAARIADRLDELDRIIAGKGVLNLMRFRLQGSGVFDIDEDEGIESRRYVVEVKFDSVLGEARQQAGALRQIFTTLGVGKATQAPPATGGTPLDDFSRRLAEREASRQARA